ncbi:DUF4158 domain-containing protein [Streptomyces sp. ITFR-21]|nr:DUF4158 domain-containing protein [Streptomyces sp. ITFR-21]WNI19678.1 DUF4158 domain-containing protein [Streptomyces sp. ITFR-21]
MGFAAQLTTARFLGVFLDDPADVPTEVADYLAEQLGVPDASVLKTYGERENTRLDHVRGLREVFGYREFAGAEAELREWVGARAWTTGEGTKALFDAAVGWLRERRVLLPGVTTLVWLMASVRTEANERLRETLYGLLNTGQRAVLDLLLEVPPVRGSRSWTGCAGGRCGCRVRRRRPRWSGRRRSPRSAWRTWTSPRCRPGGWRSCRGTGSTGRRRCCGGTATTGGWPR